MMLRKRSTAAPPILISAPTAWRDTAHCRVKGRTLERKFSRIVASTILFLDTVGSRIESKSSKATFELMNMTIEYVK